MTRPEVLRYLMKPVADLPIYLGNVDWGAYGAWAEGSMITTERVLVRQLVYIYTPVVSLRVTTAVGNSLPAVACGRSFITN